MIKIKCLPAAVFGLLFVLLLPVQSQAEELQLRVIVQKANVRLRPDASSEIIIHVSLGTVLKSDMKEGNWYRVMLPPDDRGVTKAAYIHSNIVEVITTTSNPQGEIKKEPEVFQPVEKKYPGVEMAQSTLPAPPRGKLFSGFFVKGGLMLSPNAGGLSKNWMLGFGFDLSLLENFSLGLELQPAYRSYSDLSLSVFPVSLFINGKGGIRVFKFLNAFGGAGAGAEFSLATMKFEGDNYSDFSTRFALHFLLGLEFVLKPVVLFTEYQMTAVPDPNVKPNFLRHLLFFGVRF